MTVRFTSYHLALLFMLLVWTEGGCARQSLPAEPVSEHASSLALSLKNVQPDYHPQTKMSMDISQSNGTFRGIEHLYIIPFDTVTEEVEYEDSRLGSQNVVLGTSGISRTGLVSNNNAHYISSAFVPTGMNRVLVYGKSPDEGEGATKASKHTYGSLVPEGLENPSGSADITFRLEPILASGESDEMTEVLTKADAVLDQLNVVMSLLGSSENASIVSIYDVVKRENQILACSYMTFDQIRSEIQTALLRVPIESTSVITEIGQISTAINAFSTSLTQVGSSFPTDYGIPEGAIGFWWNGNAFIRLINGVNIALVDPASYCYPPNLWYYANSSIRTSNNENVKNQYVPTNGAWDDILSHYNDGQTVSAVTQSVAIKDRLEYGVGVMELCLDEPGPEVTSQLSKCRLMGIIVGDQKDVDFSFVPMTGPSRSIYDNDIGDIRIGEPGASVRMLVLPTADHTPVRFVLEFRNSTGQTMHCPQGDILPWCRFYLAGELNPDAQTGVTQPSGKVFHSVFSRDYITRVSVSIGSLRNAYNTVPDLRSPQLEIGLVAEMKWMQFTPQSIKLEY